MLNYIEELGSRAKVAEKSIAMASSIVKDDCLIAIAQAIRDKSHEIVTQNSIDLGLAAQSGMSISMQDRLMLNADRISAIAEAVISLVKLDDPIGNVVGGGARPNGLKIKKVRVPLGVIGIIYEARPNVTVDAATLCLKAGNVVILKGGKEAYNSNKFLVNIMRTVLENSGLSPDIIQFVNDTSRETTIELMKCNEYLDVLIPRGGAGLIKSVLNNASVPVIETGIGNCHAYVDKYADLDMAVRIVSNAKISRPSVCNSIETLLVHREIAHRFLPLIYEEFNKHKVEMRGCGITKATLGQSVITATEEDYSTEFSDYIIAVKVVNTMDEAIEHIAKYSSCHSEVIITNNYARAEKFQNEVDAATVYVNASTRFTDGSEFGFGAEIGISTQKLHARGPMGLLELTSTKYLINGNGQIR